MLESSPPTPNGTRGIRKPSPRNGGLDLRRTFENAFRGLQAPHPILSPVDGHLTTSHAWKKLARKEGRLGELQLPSQDLPVVVASARFLRLSHTRSGVPLWLALSAYLPVRGTAPRTGAP